MTKPKVVLVTQDFYPRKGGIARYLMGICKKYLGATTLTVILDQQLGNPEDFAHLPCQVHLMPFALFDMGEERSRVNAQLLAAILALEPDTLLFGYVRAHIEVALLVKEKRPATTVGLFTHAKEAYILNGIQENNHTGATHKGYTQKEASIYWRTITQLDHIFSVSSFTAQLLKQQGLQSPVALLPPCISLDAPDQYAPQIEKKPETQGRSLLAVGRLIQRKGQDRLVALMPRLLDICPDLRLTLVGGGPMASTIKAQIQHLGLKERVTMTGEVSEAQLWAHYLQADIFCLPCRFLLPNDIEGFGIVFLEAALAKLPVIATDCGGISDAVEHGKSGLLTEPEDEEALFQALKYLLMHPKKAKEMGEQGWHRVTAQFGGSPSKQLIDVLVPNFERGNH